MDSTSSFELTLLVLVIGLAMTLLAGAIVLFTLYYQQRMLRIKANQQAQETAYQKDLLEASIQSQEAERSRIAQDLHDGVGAMLSTIRLQVAFSAQKSADTDPSNVADTKALIDETIESVRRISKDLKPQTLKELGLTAALRELVSRVENTTGLVFKAEMEELPRVSIDRELAVFRMFQEMINNALKHSSATELFISAQPADDQIFLHFSDNGCGFESNAKRSEGLGLKNLNSRAAFVDGLLTMETAPGEGTRFSLLFPVSINEDTP